MKVIILAAGYATRLYPLTLTQPKPLLPVAGKPMIDHVLDNLAGVPGIDRVYVVTNAKFAAHFQQWSDAYSASKTKVNFSIVNDGSTDDSNKLGAIGDLHLVLTREKIDDDIIVVAGDNLFNQPLTGFVELARAKKSPVLAVYDVGNLEQIKKYNSITVAADGRITFFEEKPKAPESTLTGIALYYYPKSVVPLIHQYIAEGNNPDQPGRLIQWLYPRVPVYTWKVPGLWFDIGSKETLEEANRIFAKPETPTARQYQEAFQQIFDQLSDKQREMLRVHYHALNRKLSAHKLAETVGYPNYESANLHYGTIGGLLCDVLGQEPKGEKLSVFVHLIPPHTESNDEWLWQMKEPAAQALQDLGWV